MEDSGDRVDGYRALMVFQQRFDNKTSANMDLTKGIHKWEADIASLKNRFDEGINEILKSAILIGVIPKEYQDMVLQTFAVSTDFQFSGTRDYIINVANNRAQMNKPTPNVGSVEGEQGYESNTQQEDWEGYDSDLAALHAQRKSYKSGQWGHIAVNCPRGKGKGGGMRPKGKGKGKQGAKGYSRGYNRHGA